MFCVSKINIILYIILYLAFTQKWLFWDLYILIQIDEFIPLNYFWGVKLIFWEDELHLSCRFECSRHAAAYLGLTLAQLETSMWSLDLLFLSWWESAYSCFANHSYLLVLCTTFLSMVCVLQLYEVATIISHCNCRRENRVCRVQLSMVI